MKKRPSVSNVHLKTMTKEIHKTLDQAIDSFSVLRSVGKPDGKDDYEEHSESDDDHSLDFLSHNDASSKILGPQIPTERRMVLAQIIQKMAAVWKEKKNNKSSIIQRWRLIRLSERLKHLKETNQGYFKLNKIFDKRYNALFKILEAGRVKQQLAEVTAQNFFESTIVDQRSSSRSKSPIAGASKKYLSTTHNIKESMVIGGNTTSEGLSSLEAQKMKIDMESLKSTIASLKSQVSTLQTQLQSITRERNDLSTLVQSLQSSSIPSTQSKTLTTKTTTLITQDIIPPSPGRNQRDLDMDALRNRVKALEGEIGDRINEARNMEIEYKKRIEEIRLDNGKNVKPLKDTEDRLRADIQSLRSKLDEANRQITAMRDSHSIELATARMQAESEKRTIMEERNKVIEGKNEEIRKIKMQYEDTIEKIKSQANDRSKLLRESFEKQTSEYRDKISQLLKKVSEASSGGERDLRHAIETQIRMEIADDKNRMEKAYDDLEHLLFQTKSQLSVSERDNLDLREQINHLKEAIASMATGRNHTTVQQIGRTQVTQITHLPLQQAISKAVASSASSNLISPNQSARGPSPMAKVAQKGVTSARDIYMDDDGSDNEAKVRMVTQQRFLSSAKNVQGANKIPPQYYGQILTGLKKGRIMLHALRDYQRMMKQKSFNNIFKSTVLGKRSRGEAGLRIKARLVVLLREKYKDVGIRRAFLRWAIFINRTFLRDCITKVALHSRITHQSALWRFRKLSQKNVRVRLPEAAKKLRYMAGLHIIDLLFKLSQFTNTVEAMNKMRPAIVGKVYRVLIEVLNKKSQKEETTKHAAFNRLVQTHRRQKSFIQKFVDRLNRKLSDALQHLIRNNSSRRLAENMMFGDRDVGESITILQNGARKNVDHAIRVLGNRSAYERHVRNTVNRCTQKDRSMLREALDKLRLHNHMTKVQLRRLHLIQRDTFNMVAGKQDSKARTAFDILRNHSTSMSQSETVETINSVNSKRIRAKRLRDFMNKLRKSCLTKQGEALNRARNLRDTESAKDALDRLKRESSDKLRKRILKEMLDRLKQTQGIKLGDALDKLRELADKDNLMERIKTLERRIVKTKEDDDRELQNALDKARNEYRKKMIAQALSQLKNNITELQRDTLHKFMNTARVIYQTTTIETTIQQTKEIRRRTIIKSAGQRLLNSVNAKELGALKKLVENKTILKFEEDMRNEKSDNGKKVSEKVLRKLLERLSLAQSGKSKEALFKLGQYKNKIDHAKDLKKINEDTLTKLRRQILLNNFERLRNAQENKQNDALQRLKNFTKDIIRQEMESEFRIQKVNTVKKSQIKSLIDRLINRTKAKESEAFAKLTNKNSILQERIEETKTEMRKLIRKKMITSALDRLSMAQKGKENAALANLIKNYIYEQKTQEIATSSETLKKIMRNRTLKSLADKLKNAQVSKQKQVVYYLHEKVVVDIRDHTLHKTIRTTTLQSVFSTLLTSTNSKLLHSTHRLHGNRVDRDIRDREDKDRMDRWKDRVRRVMERIDWRARGRDKVVLRRVFDKLKAPKVDTRSRLFDKIFSAQRSKTMKTLYSLYINSINSNKEDKLQDVLHRIATKARINTLNALNTLRRHHTLMEGREGREEREKRERRRKIDGVGKRMALVQTEKVREAIRQLVAAKRELENEEAMRIVKEEMARRILKKLIERICDRVRMAHDAKQKEVLNELLKKTREEQYELEKKKVKEDAERALDQLRLDDFKTLEETKEQAVKKIFKRLTERMADRLKLAHDAKEKEVLTALLHMRKIVESEEMLRETREDARKNLLKKITEKLNERLKLAQEAKEKDALIGLLMQKRAIESEEAVRETKEDAARRVMTRLLQRLADRLRLAHDAKEKEVLTALLLMKKVVEAEEENRRVREEAERVLEETREEARKSVLRKALQKLSDRLKLAHDAKEKEVLAGLLHMKKAVEAEEAVRETKEDAARRVLRKATMLLADRLKLAHDAKEKEVLLGLLLMKKAVQHEEDVRTLKEEADRILQETKAVDAEMLEDAREEARKTLEEEGSAEVG
jgi:hypothetical protein